MTSPLNPSTASQLRNQIWNSTIPLQISISSSTSPASPSTPPPFYLNVPRLSYIPFLLPRLHRFFAPYLQEPSSSSSGSPSSSSDTPQPHDGWFSYDGVPLKWHYPVGLLHDLYAPPSTPSPNPASTTTTTSSAAPPPPRHWSLLLHFTPTPPTLIPLDASGKVLHDAYINTLKESDYLRYGSAKGIMSLSVADAAKLWAGIETHTQKGYWDVMGRLLSPSNMLLKHVPVRVYLASPPPPPPPPEAGGEGPAAGRRKIRTGGAPVQQQITVHQPPLAPTIAGRVPAQPQTVGTALHTLLPNLFTSRRRCTIARPVLHGVVVPMEAELEALMRSGAGYADGFIHIVVELMD